MNINKILGSLAALMIITFSLSSCEKEKPLEEQIIGKWEVQSVRIVNYENNVKKSEITYFLESDEMALQFAEGGTGISFENGEEYGLFDWSLEGTTLTMGSDTEWTISIDGNTLVWSFTETGVQDNITYTYEYFFTAVKTP